MKAMLPVKAQLMAGDKEAAWFAGRVPRRILTLPFGGPIPSSISPIGVDLDGEWFDERTDIYGPHRVLRQERERLVDWNHAAVPPSAKYGDPTRMMSGHFLGKSILDPDPEEDGWWSDFWFKAGEKRVALIKQLSDRGAQLFGSSQPAPGVSDQRRPYTIWPHLFQTLSTSPQNTYSVIRPKAMLDEADQLGINVSDAFRALLADAAALDGSLRSPDLARAAAKAGRELSETNLAELEAMLDEWHSGYEAGVTRLRGLIARVRSKYAKEDTTDG